MSRWPLSPDVVGGTSLSRWPPRDPDAVGGTSQSRWPPRDPDVVGGTSRSRCVFSVRGFSGSWLVSFIYYSKFAGFCQMNNRAIPEPFSSRPGGLSYRTIQFETGRSLLPVGIGPGRALLPLGDEGLCLVAKNFIFGCCREKRVASPCRVAIVSSK